MALPALEGLQGDLVGMGGLLGCVIERSVEALERLDESAAREVIQDIAEISQWRSLVEERAVELIATRKPTAREAQRLVAVLDIAGELARAGDHAARIAEIALCHQNTRQPLLQPPGVHALMAETTRVMLRRGLDAFIEEDAGAAGQIAAEGELVHALYRQAYMELLGYILEDPRTLDRASWLLWAAQNLERISHCVTRVCERVAHSATGATEEAKLPCVESASPEVREAVG
jgi:phosphate transport system protein